MHFNALCTKVKTNCGVSKIHKHDKYEYLNLESEYELPQNIFNAPRAN